MVDTKTSSTDRCLDKINVWNGDSSSSDGNNCRIQETPNKSNGEGEYILL